MIFFKEIPFSHYLSSPGSDTHPYPRILAVVHPNHCLLSDISGFLMWNQVLSCHPSPCTFCFLNLLSYFFLKRIPSTLSLWFSCPSSYPAGTVRVKLFWVRLCSLSMLPINQPMHSWFFNSALQIPVLFACVHIYTSILTTPDLYSFFLKLTCTLLRIWKVLCRVKTFYFTISL